MIHSLEFVGEVPVIDGIRLMCDNYTITKSLRNITRMDVSLFVKIQEHKSGDSKNVSHLINVLRAIVVEKIVAPKDFTKLMEEL